MYASDDIILHPYAISMALAQADREEKIGGISFLHRNTIEDYGGKYAQYGFDVVGGNTFPNFGLILHKAFLETDGFDERYKFYWADVDLCQQLWSSGYTIISSPYSLVEHNNIVDKNRRENVGDRYYQDTMVYYKKWNQHALFKKKNALSRDRHILSSPDAKRVFDLLGMLATGVEFSKLPGQNQKTGSKQSKSTKNFTGVKSQLKESNFLVSALVSTYNAARFLPDLIHDLQAQTIADQLEIIIVNSGSTQNEQEIVHKFQEQYSNIVYLRTEERETVYAAWNRAVQLARGKYLTNANTDDRHAPNAYEKMVRVLESRPDVDVVYADCAITQTENTTLATGPILGRFRWPPFNRQLLFQVCFIGPQPMWRRLLHKKFGLFNSSLKSAGDYEFWLRIAEHANFHHLPEVLGLYLESATSIEHAEPKTALLEAESAREQHWDPSLGARPLPGGNFLERYSPIPASVPLDTYPLVSVIIPTYNRPSGLRDALESIARQTYPNIEVIVVNDAGRDVRKVIDRFQESHSIHYLTHKRNCGAGGARNSGLKIAKGKYITYLDDDDQYHPEHLFALVAELENNPHMVAAYSDAIQITVSKENGKTNKVDRRVVYSFDFSLERLFIHNYIPILCIMYKKSSLEKVGYFNEDMVALEDWEWMIRLAKTGNFSHIPFATAEYLVRYGEQTRNILKRETIQSLYQDIYRQHTAQTINVVREEQRRFYASVTGCDLKNDAPDLFFDHDIKFTKARKTLEILLNADDIVIALQENEPYLNSDLLNSCSDKRSYSF